MNDSGSIEICEDCFEIRLGGTPLPLEPRVYDFVVYLIANRHRVVPKSELVAEVWKQTAVADSAISRCAYQARRGLGNPRLIATVPRRGYRWVGEVK